MKENASQKRWRVENPEKVRDYHRKWREKNPDTLHDYHLRRAYGITLAEYHVRLAAQGGGCAICGETDPAKHRGRRYFHVDHDHDSGVIRGILCGQCNTAIGMLKDSSILAQAAVQYLAGHGK
jgi:hypothetical protein